MSKTNLFLLTHEELLDYYDDLLQELYVHHIGDKNKLDEVANEIIDRMKANN